MTIQLNQILNSLESIQRSLGQSSKPTLTFGEAAAYLGLSKSYLYKLTASGEIPFSKPGGKLVYFDREALDKWAMRRPVQSRSQIEETAIRHLNRRTAQR